MPKVSIVVPNYNHARFLQRRLESVLQQTFYDFELILLDDCSTDDSRSLLSSYASDPRVRVEFNTTNSGSTFKQWNKGIRMARGQYVWVAESDDYADERMLGRLVAMLDAERKAAFSYCRSWRVDGDDRSYGFGDFYLVDLDQHRWTADFCAEGHEECRNYLVIRNTIPNASAVLFRKSIYELVGGVDENLRLCGDWKLWAAMALTGSVLYLGEPLNYFRFHEATVRSKNSHVGLEVAESLQVIRWILDRVTPSQVVLQKVCAMQAAAWVPAVMSTHVPLGRKLAILRSARLIDPHPMRRVIGPAVRTLRLKLSRHWRLVP